jgi:hypothetical protein
MFRFCMHKQVSKWPDTPVVVFALSPKHRIRLD